MIYSQVNIWIQLIGLILAGYMKKVTGALFLILITRLSRMARLQMRVRKRYFHI